MTVADLRASLDYVLGELENVQSAVGVVKDRNDGARGALGIATETSNKDEFATALAALANADDLCDAVLVQVNHAKEQIELGVSAL